MKQFMILGFFITTLCSAAGQELSSERQSFDFWIGEWKVYKYGTDTLVGESTISSQLDKKMVEENYRSTAYNYFGRSFNTYNSVALRWEQYYVDNQGLVLHLKGNKKGNQMILEECLGSGLCNKIIWTDEKNGNVRQEWIQKNGNDGEWNKIFDGAYKKAKN